MLDGRGAGFPAQSFSSIYGGIMVSRIQEKLGTAGFVIAIVALVAALSGGAYAATSSGKRHHKKNNAGLNGKQKKQVRNIANSQAKKYANSNPGAPGPQGPQGSVGPQGPKGDAGAAGQNGSNGTNGTNGTNGEAGMCSEANPECVLPSGGVLTGVWSVSGGEHDFALATISFPLRVSPAPTAIWENEFAGNTVGYELGEGAAEIYGPHSMEEINEALANGEEAQAFLFVEEDATAFSEACPGNANQPEADSGFLCIYRHNSNGSFKSPLALASATEAASEFGITVPYEMNTNGSYVRGTWAVGSK